MRRRLAVAERDAYILAIRPADMEYPRLALSGLEEFDGDFFAFDVDQFVDTEHNRKGFRVR